MKTSWSSRQLINRKDRISLLNDLLALSMKLQKEDSNTMGIMTNMTLKDMTQNTTMKSTLENIIINLEKGLRVN